MATQQSNPPIQRSQTQIIREVQENGLQYGKQVFGHVTENDQELWNLITDVPRLNMFYMVICAVLNVGLAGSGTVLAGCLVDKTWNKTQIIVGLMQFMTSPYLIGWGFSIYWSYLLFLKATKDQSAVNQFLQASALRSDQPPNAANRT